MKIASLVNLSVTVFVAVALVSTPAFAQKPRVRAPQSAPYISPAEALATAKVAVRGLDGLARGDHDPVVQPAPAGASGAVAELHVMSVTNAAVQVMFHVSGIAPGMGTDASAQYMINGVVVSPTVVSTNNNLNANGSYVQVITVPATAATGRFMAASLHHLSGTADASPKELPPQAYARNYSGREHYSETQNGAAYALFDDICLTGDQYHAGAVVNVTGRNNLRTSYDNGWPLWLGGAGGLITYTSAKPLGGTDFIEVSFYLYNPTNTTVNNARIAMYGDIMIGNDDFAPVDPLRGEGTDELIGFTMTNAYTLQSLALINRNANKYGAETAPNEWGLYSDLKPVSVWDADRTSAHRLHGIDSGAIPRVRNISVPGGALHVYSFYIGAGDVSNIGDQIDSFHSVTGITGVPTEAVLGIPLQITGTVIPFSATNQRITWSMVSDGGTGAQLSDGMLLNHTLMGMVTIRATVVDGVAVGENYVQDFSIAVMVPPYSLVTGIADVPTETMVGVSLHITGTVLPPSAEVRNIVWSMTDNGGTGATFGNSVIHTPLLPGTITLRATIVDGIATGVNYVQYFTVTVTPSPYNSVMLIAGVPTETLVNRPLPITGTAMPVTADNRDIIWSVVDNGNTGARLSGGNLLDNPQAQGLVTIRGLITNGVMRGVDYTQFFIIAVNPIPVEDITDVPARITVGVPLALTGTITPDSATNLTVTWSVLGAGAAGGRITDGNILSASDAGNITVRAVIANGIRLGVDFTKDFTVEAVRSDITDWIFDLSPATYNGLPQGIPAPQPPEGVTEHGAVSVLYDGAASMPVNAGTYSVSLNVEESSLYNAINIVLGDFTINPKQLPNAPLSVETQLYAGVGVTPPVTITDGAVELVYGSDYTLTYENNVAVGDGATVTAMGTGNYRGEAFGTFTIIRGRGARLSAGPNPTRRRSNGTNFYWQGYNVRHGVLRIYDAQGNFVNAVEITDSVFDNHESRIVGTWDLTNRAGRFVRAGVYLVRGTLDTAEGKRENVSLLIGVGGSR